MACECTEPTPCDTRCWNKVWVRRSLSGAWVVTWPTDGGIGTLVWSRWRDAVTCAYGKADALKRAEILQRAFS